MAGIPRIHVLTVPKVMVQVGAMAIVHGRMSSAFQRRPPVRAKATVYGGMTSVLLIPVSPFHIQLCFPRVSPFPSPRRAKAQFCDYCLIWCREDERIQQ